MRAQLKAELAKAQAKEVARTEPVTPVQSPERVDTSGPTAQPLQPIVIQLGERSARIDVAPSQVVGLLDVLKRYQEGQT